MCSLNHRSVFGEGYSEFMLSGVVASELGQMVAQGLAPMTAAGFLRDLTQEVIQDVENHVLGVDRLRVVVADHGGSGVVPVAFAASNVREVSAYRPQDNTMLHLGGIIVDRSYQSEGVGKKLVQDELNQTNASLLSFHTQNLHMLNLGRQLTEYTLAYSSGFAEELGTPEPAVQMLGKTPSVIHIGRYGGQSLYGDLKQFRRKGMAIKGLNTRNGDAVVYVGEVQK